MGLGSATKVHLLAGSTDMRLGFEGLFALARVVLLAEPLSGHVFGFCNKGRNRLKLLYWDGSGLWVCAKRLEKGRFAWPEVMMSEGSAARGVVMTQTELAMLLSGIDLKMADKRKWHRLENTGGVAQYSHDEGWSKTLKCIPPPRCSPG
jgi:transposase